VSAELLPCPFCGSASIEMANERHDHSGGYFIGCPECDASTGLRFACGDDPRPLLVEQWNRRTPPQANVQPADSQADMRECGLCNGVRFIDGATCPHCAGEGKVEFSAQPATPQATPATHQPAEQGERALFEAWYSDGGQSIRAVTRSGDGYLLAQAQSAWTAWRAGWQAARAAPITALTDAQIRETFVRWQINGGVSQAFFYNAADFKSAQ